MVVTVTGRCRWCAVDVDVAQLDLEWLGCCSAQCCDALETAQCLPRPVRLAMHQAAQVAGRRRGRTQ